MEREGSVTLAEIKKGATPNEVTEVGAEECYYYLPESATNKLKVKQALIEAGFKSGERGSEHTPEPGEVAHVVLVSYRHNDGPFVAPGKKVPETFGDGRNYYYLPGNREQIAQVLEEVGFERGGSLMDAVDAAYKSQGDS